MDIAPAVYQAAQLPLNEYSLSNYPGGAAIRALSQPAPVYVDGHGTNICLKENGFIAAVQSLQMDVNTAGPSHIIDGGIGPGPHVQPTQASATIPGPSHYPGSAGPSLHHQSAPVLGYAGFPDAFTTTGPERADQRGSSSSAERGKVFERDKVANVNHSLESERAEAIRSPRESEPRTNGYPRPESALSMVGQCSAPPTPSPTDTRNHDYGKEAAVDGNMIEGYPSPESALSMVGQCSATPTQTPIDTRNPVCGMVIFTTNGNMDEGHPQSLPMEAPRSLPDVSNHMPASTATEQSPVGHSGSTPPTDPDLTGGLVRFSAMNTMKIAKWCRETEYPHAFAWETPDEALDLIEFMKEERARERILIKRNLASRGYTMRTDEKLCLYLRAHLRRLKRIDAGPWQPGLQKPIGYERQQAMDAPQWMMDWVDRSC